MRFQKTYCSQCGGEFGPGDSGFSHCDQHASDVVACPACCSASGTPRPVDDCRFCGGVHAVSDARAREWSASS